MFSLANGHMVKVGRKNRLSLVLGCDVEFDGPFSWLSYKHSVIIKASKLYWELIKVRSSL